METRNEWKSVLRKAGTSPRCWATLCRTELDKELKNHGMHIERFADDFMIVVGSEASAKRVMYSVTGRIERKLGLEVNVTKTKRIKEPVKVKYLGFSFYMDAKTKEWKCLPYEEERTYKPQVE